jgi:hypothetical protein
MKNKLPALVPSSHIRHAIAGAVAIACALAGAPTAPAANLYYDGTGGSWSADGENWRTGPDQTGTLGTWVDGSTAVFTSSVTITPNINLTLGGLIFSPTDTTKTLTMGGSARTLSFSSGAEIDIAAASKFGIGNSSARLAGSNGFTKTGAGDLYLIANTASSFSGTITHNGGTLQLQSADAAGTSGNIIVTGGTTLQFFNNANTTYGSTQAVSVTIGNNATKLNLQIGTLGGVGINSATHTLGALSLGARTINASGYLTANGSASKAVFANTTLTGSATLDIESKAAISLGALSETGSNRSLNKYGVGELILRGAVNTATGSLGLKDGTTTIDVDGGNTASFASGLNLGDAGKTTTLALNAHHVIFAQKLNVLADTTIDFAASGASSLAFTGGATTWDGTGLLFITNFNAAEDSLRIGVAATALSSDQLARIIWVGLGVGGSNLTGAFIDADGYITATSQIPEPATWTLLVALGAFAAVLLRRKAL